MASSGTLRHVALVRTDVSVEPPILVALMMEALRSSETSVLTRATRRNIQVDTILHSHRRGNSKSYTVVIVRLRAKSHGVCFCFCFCMYIVPLEANSTAHFINTSLVFTRLDVTTGLQKSLITTLKKKNSVALSRERTI
jgi:hypothetical protein